MVEFNAKLKSPFFYASDHSLILLSNARYLHLSLLQRAAFDSSIFYNTLTHLENLIYEKCFFVCFMHLSRKKITKKRFLLMNWNRLSFYEMERSKGRRLMLDKQAKE